MKITLKSSLDVWLLTSFTFIHSFYWGFVLLSQLKYILTVWIRYTLSHFLLPRQFFDRHCDPRIENKICSSCHE